MRQSRRALASAQESSEGIECRRRTAGFLSFCFFFLCKQDVKQPCFALFEKGQFVIWLLSAGALSSSPLLGLMTVLQVFEVLCCVFPSSFFVLVH